MVRTQVTTYLNEGQKQWLAEYSRVLGVRQSELVRILVERERRLRWLETVLNAPPGAMETNLASAMVDCLKKFDP